MITLGFKMIKLLNFYDVQENVNPGGAGKLFCKSVIFSETLPPTQILFRSQTPNNRQFVMLTPYWHHLSQQTITLVAIPNDLQMLLMAKQIKRYMYDKVIIKKKTTTLFSKIEKSVLKFPKHTEIYSAFQ